MKYEKSCGTIIFKDDEILLIKQQRGHWDFPKGHVEDDETEVETALRETKEETNLDVLVDESRRYKITYSPKENTIKDVIFFVAKPLSYDAKPQIEEVAEIRWIKVDEAINLLTYDDTRSLLKDVIADRK